MNKAIIIGRLGRTPELRYTSGGTAVLDMSVAVDERKKNEKVTTWFRVSVWDKRAEGLANLELEKGTLVCCEGAVSIDTYEAKDGTPKASLKLNASNIELLGGKRDGGQRDEAPRGGGGNSRPPKRQEPEGDYGGGAVDDDEIPFLAVDERLS